MLIVLLRHGQTAYNEQRRYQGAADVPLSPAGRAALKKADFETETVYVTPLCRTAQTARILFPHARQIVVPALREMDFGVFEGRTYDEMKDDAAYCAWLDSGCESACPNGESKAVFCKRVCRAFEKLADEALARGDERLVIVAHGGTQMAALSRFAEPHRDYYSWNAPPAGGFVLSADEWRARRALRVIKTVGNAAGFVGCCVVLGVLFALVIKTFLTGARSEDLLGTFICAGIGGALMAQIAVNVGMNLRVLPVIGVTLPFYSAGGSSVLMLYICVGLVLSVYTHNTKKLFG